MAPTASGPERLAAAPEPFEDFYRREIRAVISLAYALTGRARVAEELAQEAFIAAWRRWDEVGGYNRPSGWVRRVVTNLAVSRTRRWLAEGRALGRLGRTTDAVPAPTSDAIEFWAAVRALPARQAQVVALHYLEDKPLRDIAGLLGCSEGSVKTHLMRARQKLAQSLDLDPGGVNENDDAG